MKKILIALTCVAPLPVAAQSFTGAELSAEVSYTTGDNALGFTSYAGAAEFQVMGPLSVAADFSFNGFGSLDASARNFTLHGSYDTGYDINGGVFIGYDDFDGATSTIYGVEGKFQLPGAALEGFLAYADGDRDMKLVGVEGEFALTSEIYLTGKAGFGSSDLDDASRVGFGGEYRFAQGPIAYGEIGRLSNDGGSENYIAVGARVALGYAPGTTFGRRGIADVLRGY
ncbi:hypothetical protein BVG79_01016 [Ketogulonicigenium robustum]|uniref:Porin n=1 Tax=Ketogulonicigenium robustum TaxID=92947 RepID=A0A1W6NYP7_9RHOB|nr:hypothetical protein [Ketogulonicigenium robustum]ARO14362.1 hypothetical protein BVG79_01016 [Ketogulonicigenium robustum]